MPRCSANLSRWLSCLALAAICCGSAGMLAAADIYAGPRDYREFLPRLVAGDRLFLSAGDYPRGLPLQRLHGTAERPIVISGPATGQRARFIARPGANTVSLVDVRHIHIRNLELDGGNQPVDALKAEGHAAYADFVTLENLYIHDHAASQQNVGISTKCPAIGWVIRGNRIERVGTGMYFGNSDGSDPFVGGLIEANTISDTLGYNLQIKHQKTRPSPMSEADARHDSIIRRNIFSKADGAPPGPMARPNVLIGHMPLAGSGIADRTLIYANLFWQNPGESLFQGEGNLALYNNVFVTSGPDALRIQPHNDLPRAVQVVFNSVVAAGNGISVVEPEHNLQIQLVAGNVVFAARPVQGGVKRDNFVGAHDEAERYLLRPSAGLDEIDLSPRPGWRPSAAVAAKWRAELPADLPEIEFDYAGKPRPPGMLGAFAAPARP